MLMQATASKVMNGYAPPHELLLGNRLNFLPTPFGFHLNDVMLARSGNTRHNDPLPLAEALRSIQFCP